MHETLRRRSPFALGACLVLGVCLLHPDAWGQAVVVEDVAVAAQPFLQPGEPAPSPGTGALSSQFSALKIVEEPKFRQIINVARDCIKDKAWSDAVTALQTILDSKQDHYVQVREKDASGREVMRWTSVKFEANKLLGTMPQTGLDLYEQRYGGRARAMLQEAREKGDRELLAEVAQRFQHTEAGLQATDLLATWFLDRGQFFMASLRFEKLLKLPPDRSNLSDLTLFKAALAYRRAGDIDKAQAAWRSLQDKVQGVGGLTINGELVALDRLKQILDEIPGPSLLNPHDWPYIRGNLTHTAQATGSPPLLDQVLWSRPLVLDKWDDTGEVEDRGREAKQRLDAAIAQVESMKNEPVLPGFFPIAANGLLVYRSHSDIRAVHLNEKRDAAGKVIARPGQIAWKSTEFDGALANVLAWDKTRTTLENWLTQFFNLPGFSSLVYENTLLGTLSTDHRYVYAVDDLAVPTPANMFQPYVWNAGQVSSEVKPLVMGNTLYAYDLEYGLCKWRLGGPSGPFADSHFLGAPIAVGGKLYVLNEKNLGTSNPNGDSTLRLVCIDPYKMATKQEPAVVEPIQEIGTIQQQHRITHDVSRRINAVHLAYGEGILVCPTNAGEVLGVDLSSRSLAWAYPYREQAPDQVPFTQPNPRPFPRPTPNIGTTTMANWRSAPPAIAAGLVVFTAPDANSIHCINLRDGTPVWKKRQGDGDLYFAGVHAGRALIVGKGFVRALDLPTGQQVWKVSTGDLPSGQGVACRDVYYLPLKKGEILALDIPTGNIRAHNRAKAGSPSPGNLVFHDGVVLSMTPRDIVAYPQLATRLALATKALEGAPNDPTKLVERGELLLADGQLQGAVDDLRKALSFKPQPMLAMRAKDRLYDALTDLLQADFTGASPKYLDEYQELCKLGPDPREQQARQARFLRIVAQGREAQGNLVDAFRLYREFGALPIHRANGGVQSLEDPTQVVPTDVWLRGRIGAMIARATPEQRQPLERKIQEEWDAVEKGKDLDAMRQFVGMFDVPFSVGRQARLHLAETLMDRNLRGNFLEAELSLQQLRGRDFRADPSSGGKALAGLALLEEKKGSVDSMKLAAAYYRQLRNEFPDVPVRGPLTGKALLDRMATDKRFLPELDDPAASWIHAPIGVRELPGNNFNASLQGFLFQPEGDLTPLMRNHRLVLDPTNANNPQLRLVDLTDNKARWVQSLASVGNPANYQFFQYLYQQSQNNNAYLPDARFRFFQCKGHLMVFQVGTTVFCLDVDGGKVLWNHQLIDGNLNPVPGMPVVQQVVPDEEGYLELVVWNQFNNQRTRTPVGHVGTVQASYVALVTQKGLVALDPLRGNVQWEKGEFAPGTRVFGDDRYLFVVENADANSVGTGRALRAGDGEPLAAPDFGFLYHNRIHLRGRRILASHPARDGLAVRLYDILSGKDVWTRTFDSKAVILRSDDPDLTGVVEPDGTVVVLDAATGRDLMKSSITRGQIKAEDLKALEKPLLLADADRFYVALNRPVDDNKIAGGLVQNNFTSGVRCRPINGWFAAFKRGDGEEKLGARSVPRKNGDFLWHTYKPMENQLIVVENFDRQPVLLFTSRYNERLAGGGNRWVSWTRSVHKRSGKVLYDPGARQSNSAAQYYGFQCDPRSGTLTLLGFQGSLQHFVDDGRRPAPAPGAVSDAGNTPVYPPVPFTGPPLPPGVLPPQVMPQPGIRLPINVRPPIRRIDLPAPVPERK